MLGLMIAGKAAAAGLTFLSSSYVLMTSCRIHKKTPMNIYAKVVFIAPLPQRTFSLRHKADNIGRRESGTPCCSWLFPLGTVQVQAHVAGRWGRTTGF